VLLSLHKWAFFGHYGFDDMGYAKMASHISKGIFLHDDSFAYRWTTTLPTALFYYLFGIHDFSSGLSSMLASIGLVFIISYYLRKQPIGLVLCIVAIVVLQRYVLFYSDKLMCDVQVVLWSFCSLVALQWQQSKPEKPALKALFFAISILLLVLSKETFILIFPVYIFWLIHDLIFRKNIRFWSISFALGLLFAFVYFTITLWLTGSAWARLHALMLDNYGSSYHLQPFSVTLKRITYGFASLLNNYNFSHLILIFIFNIAIIKKQGLAPFSRFWLLTFGVLLLSANCMTISWKGYCPMAIDARHFLFLVPVAAMLIVPIYDYFKTNNQTSFLLIAMGMLLLVCNALSSINENKTYYLYAGLLIFICSIGVVRSCIYFKYLLGVSILLLLLILPASDAKNALKMNNLATKNHIQLLHKTHKNETIITDMVMARVASYYVAYDTLSTRYTPSRYFNKTTHVGVDTVMLYHRWSTQYLSNETNGVVAQMAVDSALQQYLSPLSGPITVLKLPAEVYDNWIERKSKK
jgi:hypothetical protein